VYVRMSNKTKLTLSVDKKTISDYKMYCERKGLIISKQVENFMLSELENTK